MQESRFAESRFTVLLAILLLYLLVLAFLHTLASQRASGWGTIGVAAFALLLLSAVRAANPPRRARVAAFAMASLVILLQVSSIALAQQYSGLDAAARMLGSLFLAWTVTLVLRSILRARRVTYDVISAALCVYLLAGILWAGVYAAIDRLQPGSFTQEMASEGGSALWTPIYFSSVTLTTLGYGDIAPVTAWARMVAAIEAVTGQVYLAVLVAGLVSLRILHRPPDS